MSKELSVSEILINYEKSIGYVEPKPPEKLVLAFSGGMDSTVLLHIAAANGVKEIHTISFDYGQRHSRELLCMDIQLHSIREKYPNITVTNKVIDVSYIKDISPTSSLTNNSIDNPDISKIAGDAQPVSYVPFRNQMFLSICCAYAESLRADKVWYGAAQADSLAGYWDSSDCFVDSINDLVSLNREHRMLIVAPLLSMSKADIVRQGVELGVNFGDTWTCYSNRADRLADATTPSSSLRLQGFVSAGYRDPIRYVQQEKIDKIYELNSCYIP
jgi:7-cyano-7-deazaguanine synthase